MATQALLKPSFRFVVRRGSRSPLRCLATPSPSAPTHNVRTSFSDDLANGPSLDDFISEAPVQRVVLGNTKGYVPQNDELKST
jgi:lipoic acid synthetase